MKEFYDIFNENQIMVMVGETGSGKTTQCVWCPFPFLQGSLARPLARAAGGISPGRHS